MSYTPPIGNATATKQGLVRLAGDLSGTATAPTVPSLANYIPLTQKNASNGVATLDASGKIPAAQVPAVAVDYASLPAGSVVSTSTSTRPTSRTDIVVMWTGATDPGASALSGDVWLGAP